MKNIFHVNGKRFFSLGRQVHNSSAYTLKELEKAWKVLRLLVQIQQRYQLSAEISSSICSNTSN